jgi:hypothetical protein
MVPGSSKKSEDSSQSKPVTSELVTSFYDYFLAKLSLKSLLFLP